MNGAIIIAVINSNTPANIRFLILIKPINEIIKGITPIKLRIHILPIESKTIDSTSAALIPCSFAILILCSRITFTNSGSFTSANDKYAMNMTIASNASHPNQPKIFSGTLEIGSTLTV